MGHLQAKRGWLLQAHTSSADDMVGIILDPSEEPHAFHEITRRLLFSENSLFPLTVVEYHTYLTGDIFL